MRTIILVISLFISSCSKNESSNSDVYIYPEKVKDIKNIELGEVVKFYIPAFDKNKSLEWSYLANKKDIVWLNETYVEGDEGYERNGLLRINIMGINSTILKIKNMELAWSIKYVNNGNPKFGVDWVEIFPGLESGDGNCFGSTTDNCSFDPTPSLENSNIKVEKIAFECTNQLWQPEVYLITNNGSVAKLILETYGGSGGISSSIKIMNRSTEYKCMFD
jgi:hypothetical protein